MEDKIKPVMCPFKPNGNDICMRELCMMWREFKTGHNAVEKTIPWTNGKTFNDVVEVPIIEGSCGLAGEISWWRRK